MTPMRWAAIGLLAAMLACSSGGGAAKSGSSVQTLSQLASAIGCTNLDQSGQSELYTRESGTCDLNGSTLDLATFSDSGTRDQWVNAAKQSGGIFVVGDKWAVDADTQAAADAVKAKIGGTIR